MPRGQKTTLPPTKASDPQWYNWAWSITDAVNQLPTILALKDPTALTATTIANTVTETTAFTQDFSKNRYNAGSVIRIYLLGHYSTHNASVVFTARLKIGTTTLASTTSAAANVTNAPLRFIGTITVRAGGANGSVISFLNMDANNESVDVSNTAPTSLDLTAGENQRLTITVQWTIADPGSTVTIQQAYAEAIV